MDMKTDNVGWDVADCDPFGRMVSMTAWPAKAADPRPDLRPYVLLVPVDGSPSSSSALNVALQLADQRPNAEVHILNVQIISGGDEQDDRVEREGLRETREAWEILDMNQTRYQLHIATGTPAKAIHEYCRQHNVAEIVMGSHGINRFQRILLGSVAMDMAEEAAIPVTLVKPSDHAGKFPAEWVHWLVPCDGSPSALRALRYAIKHGSRFANKPKLQLLNIRQHEAAAAERPLAIDWMFHQPPPGNHQVDDERQCAEAFALLEEAQHPFDFHVEVGDPATSILAAIEQHGCAHVAMGSRGLGVLGDIVLGSVSQAVVQRAAVPVTLIK